MQQSISDYLIPKPRKISVGATDQLLSFTGTWNLTSNCGSTRLEAYVRSVFALIEKKAHDSSIEFNITWQWPPTIQQSEITIHSALGLFQPRDPFYLLFSPSTISISPVIIIKSIKWGHEWDFHDARSTDEYHLLLGKFIQITARTERGLFYGVQTLHQLIRMGQYHEVHFQTIQDAPQIAYRGISLNFTHLRMNSSYFEHFLSMLAEYKINIITIFGEDHAKELCDTHPWEKWYIDRISPETFTQVCSNRIESTWSKWALETGCFPLSLFSMVFQAETDWQGILANENQFIARFWRVFFYTNPIGEKSAWIQADKVGSFFIHLGWISTDFDILWKQYTDPHQTLKDQKIRDELLQRIRTVLPPFHALLTENLTSVDRNLPYYRFLFFLIEYQLLFLKTVGVIPVLEQMVLSFKPDQALSIPPLTTLTNYLRVLENLEKENTHIITQSNELYKWYLDPHDEMNARTFIFAHILLRYQGLQSIFIEFVKILERFSVEAEHIRDELQKKK